MNDPLTADGRRRSLTPTPGWLTDGDEPAASPGSSYLLLVTVLAAVLRLFHLDDMSLWIDEVFTWELVAPGRGLEFVEQILAAYQGPLYHAAAWPLVRLADTEFMLRLPAAIAGTLAVPLLGFLAARLWDRTTGRLAALLLALSPFGVWYAQEARGYSFLIFFAVAAGLVMVTALRRGPGWGRMVLLALLVFAGLASNFAFLFLLAAFGMTVLLLARPRDRRSWLQWCLGLGGGVVLALPWLLEAAGIWEVGRVVPGVATGLALRGESTFHPGALPFTGFTLFNGFSLGPSLAELHEADRLAVIRRHAPAIVLGTIPAAVAMVAALGRLRRGRWVLMLWILIPLAGVALLAVRNIKPYNVRYAAAALPWVLALAAAGAGGLRGYWRPLVSGLLCLVFLVSLGGYYLSPEYAKADVRAAMASLQGRQDAGPILVPTVGPVVRYYGQGDRVVLGCWDESTVTTAAAADALVARQLAGHDGAWVIWARSWYLDPQHLLPGALTRAGSLERTFDGDGVAVDRWQRRPGATPEGGDRR